MKIKIKKKKSNQPCSLCGLSRYATTPEFKVKPPKNPKFMVILDHPRNMDDRTGNTCSDVYNLVEELITGAGLDIQDAYITYAVKCKPKGIEAPTKDEINSCINKVLKEIKDINLDYILIFGSMASKLITKTTYKKSKGVALNINGKYYFVTDSPANVLKKPSKQEALLEDLKQFKRLLNKELDEDNVLNYILVDTPNKFKQCIKEVTQEKIISVDIESIGLNWLDTERGLLSTLGIGIKNKQYIVPFNHPDSPWSFNHSLHYKMVKLLTEAIEYNHTDIIYQNGKFDRKYLLTRFGIAPKNTFDTMLASYILDENSLNGLKVLAKRYCNAADYAIDTTRVIEHPLEVVAKYNAYDVYYTRKLYFIFNKMLKEDPATNRVFRELLVPVSECFENAEMTGVYLDMEKFEQNEKLIDEQIAQHMTHLKDLAPQVQNWNSTKQVGKLLFEDLGLPILERTKTGSPSTSGETVLPRLKDKHPVVQVLLDYREKIKLKQFLVSWKELLAPQDGRLHPNFKIHGTVTGRISCVDPNFQQVPREKLLRNLISAPPGWILVEADYSQAELRIAAQMSGDKEMLHCFRNKIDIHYKTAAYVAQVSLEQVTKDMRKKAKAVNFGKSSFLEAS